MPKKVLPSERGAELREGLSKAELEELAAGDRVAHAFALFDLDRFPEKIRFVSLRRQGRPFAYLLIWYGDPSSPVVHWMGTSGSELLGKGLPKPPFVALVPPELGASVAWPVPVTRTPIEFWVCRHGRAARPERPQEARTATLARRLGPGDIGTLQRFSELHADTPFLTALSGLDLSRVRLWGALSESGGQRRLLSTARCIVEIPGVWVIGGVYTEPESRGRGLARAVMRAVVEDAHRAGADCALYVRADNRAAISAYAAVGFQKASVREWVDAGGGPPP